MRLMRLVIQAAVSAILAFAMGPVARAVAGSPVASFTWFPASPHTGEPVSLASTSTDATSPIVGVAWDLADSGVFEEIGPVISTSFSAPGSHTVRLRVTAADGSSSIGAAAIEVTAPPAGVLLRSRLGLQAAVALRRGAAGSSDHSFMQWPRLPA
jgi:PKD repeat protein